jgi:hypothetical protein
MCWVGVVCMLSACSGAQPLRARVFDCGGRPVSGAVVYAAAWKNAGTHDFVFGVSDSMGYFPALQNAPAPLQWSAGSRMSLAAFSQGQRPLVLIERSLGPNEKLQLHFQCRAGSDSGHDSATDALLERRLFTLGLPFPDQAGLRDRLARPETQPLRQAFAEAYARMAAAWPDLTEEERRLVEAMGKMETVSGD